MSQVKVTNMKMVAHLLFGTLEFTCKTKMTMNYIQTIVVYPTNLSCPLLWPINTLPKKNITYVPVMPWWYLHPNCVKTPREAGTFGKPFAPRSLVGWLSSWDKNHLQLTQISKYITESLGYQGGGFNPAEKYVRQIMSNCIVSSCKGEPKKSKPPAIRIVRRHTLWRWICRHVQFQYSGSSENCRMCIWHPKNVGEGNKTYVCHSSIFNPQRQNPSGKWHVQPYTVWMIQWPVKNIYI